MECLYSANSWKHSPKQITKVNAWTVFSPFFNQNKTENVHKSIYWDTQFFPFSTTYWTYIIFLCMFCNCNEWESHSFDELSDVLLQSLPKLPTLLHCCIHCSVTNVCKQSKYLLHGIWRTTYLEYFHDVLGTTFSCLLILFASCFVIYIGSIIWRCVCNWNLS